ncbi:MAG: hypothetical protein CMD31_04370 [Flavobacteriales bacterium]|nr:hypothetical protein [Flavobacteriales bacterium]|tara:strand:- start:10775 stop:15121 length:4347 start_codon:yes stop_codon:yes gene_type:complete
MRNSIIYLLGVVLIFSTTNVSTQITELKSYVKISDTSGNFTGVLDNSDNFGGAEGIGDLDGDGIEDIAVAAHLDDDGATDAGAIWILFLNLDGSVKSHQKISNLEGSLGNIFHAQEYVGYDISNLGDLDGDGVVDIAVGAPFSNNSGTNKGTVYILFLNTDGTVKSTQEIRAGVSGFTATIDYNDYFGESITNLGDLDGDGVIDIAVGARGDDDGGSDRGAVYILFLDTDGTVKSYQKISDTQGNFTGTLNYNVRFGSGLENIGDLDGDGVVDIIVGSFWDDDGGTDRGAIWVLFLDTNGTVKSHQKISDTQGGFGGVLDNSDIFGSSNLFLGDVDNDGYANILVTVSGDDDGGTDRGAVWLLNLNTDGTVRDEFKISDSLSTFNGVLSNGDRFGSRISLLGDINNDGILDFVVGAAGTDDGGTDRGAFYIMSFDAAPTEEAFVKNVYKISDTEGGFTGTLDNTDYFGYGIAELGDLDGDGVEDVVVGAVRDGDGVTYAGALWVLFLNTNGTVKSHQKISNLEGGLGNILHYQEYFGFEIENIGDIDGDGVVDIAVGTPLSNNSGTNKGTIYVLFLNTDGTVKSMQEIRAGVAGFTGTIDYNDYLGTSITNLGDLDGDGIVDIAVSARGDDDGGTDRGAVWVLFLDSNATVKSYQKISDTAGGFTGVLDNSDQFGYGVENIGDLNKDGVTDIIVGAIGDDDGGTDRGAVWILFLNTDGTVKSHQKISSTSGNFDGVIDDGDRFGRASLSLGDMDGDGYVNIIVTATSDDDGGTDQGAAWMLNVDNDGVVKSYKKISELQGGFSYDLDNTDLFGINATAIGDIDNDGYLEFVVCSVLDDDGGTDRGAFYIITLNFPFFVNYVTTQETPDTLGSIELTPTGGTPPYYYFWDDGDQSQNRYNLESGLYSVTIVDTLMDSLNLVIPVDVEVQIADSQGVTFNNRYLEKTAATGWGTGKMSFSNVVKGDGSVRVEIINDNKEWAFGYRLSANAQAVYYDSLDYGFYINSGDTLYTWNKSTSTLTYIGSITAGDILSIEREGGLVMFKKNDIFISEVSVNVNNEYRLDFSMYSNQVRIKIHVINFLFWPRPKPIITHLNCYESSTGAIDIFLSGNTNGITGFQWTIPNSMFTYATQNISGLVPGAYRLTIFYGSSLSLSRTYYVGYEVEWKNVFEATTNGNSITKTTATSYGTSGASSINVLRTNQSGWIEFKVPQHLNNFTVGFAGIDADQNPNSIEYGLTFFYIPFGTFGTFNLFGVIENGTIVPNTVTSYNTNEAFKIDYYPSANPVPGNYGTITYSRAHAAFLNWYTIPPPNNHVSTIINPPPGKFLLDIALSEQGKGITDVNTSFGCPPPGYAILDRKLNAGFYSTVKQHLWFQYNEEYSNTSVLNAVVYGENQTVVHTIPSQTITKVGANYYDLDLTTLSPVLNPNKFYVLEVTNSKNEKFLLRFLYQ